MASLLVISAVPEQGRLALLSAGFVVLGKRLRPKRASGSRHHAPTPVASCPS